ncbi:hypothetical protein HELRODRAFT_187796 [Helobdella robusta]|uniref:UPAR/Ly6 domain-containing protein n=1 Tax=Helobdella robusta TaxID=6412 RepID=T1FPD7_HELRO|nr:hypothetical protein HELRODRAFT_187796 [Helobdella robusta]ESO12222.1 hypothetical protein HELRODRAFT_187796 [Helobdella robusta]
MYTTQVCEFNNRRMIAALLSLILFVTSADALQCYNCRGITNYDVNSCFNPTPQSTYIQECAKNEVCEKRVTQVDRLQDVIDRGCSPNCKAAQFVWTDEFQVYCCNDKSMCNGASTNYYYSTNKLASLIVVSLLCSFVHRLYGRII